MNFNKIFWKNGTYENIKNDKKTQNFTLPSESILFEIYS